MGVTIFDYEEAELKKTLIERSNQVIMGVTADKLPGVARYTIANCDQISILVMDKNLNSNIVELFAETSLKIVMTD